MTPRYFYECGGCDHLHPLGWTGDCRENSQRYTSDVLDEPGVYLLAEEAPMPPAGYVPAPGVDVGCGSAACRDCYEREAKP